MLLVKRFKVLFSNFFSSIFSKHIFLQGGCFNFLIKNILSFLSTSFETIYQNSTRTQILAHYNLLLLHEVDFILSSPKSFPFEKVNIITGPLQSFLSRKSELCSESLLSNNCASAKLMQTLSIAFQHLDP